VSLGIRGMVGGADTSENAGSGRIFGTVAVAPSPGTPVSRRVHLFVARTGRIVRQTWSEADGSYAFTKLTLVPEYWIVVAHDHTKTHNAVIADLATAE